MLVQNAVVGGRSDKGFQSADLLDKMIAWFLVDGLRSLLSRGSRMPSLPVQQRARNSSLIRGGLRIELQCRV